MLLQGKAADAANDIMRAFQNPNELPAPLAQVFIRRRDKVPCRAWSCEAVALVLDTAEALREPSPLQGDGRAQHVSC
jgi:hypothetical protein